MVRLCTSLPSARISRLKNFSYINNEDFAAQTKQHHSLLSFSVKNLTDQTASNILIGSFKELKRLTFILSLHESERMVDI